MFEQLYVIYYFVQIVAENLVDEIMCKLLMELCVVC